MINAAVILLKFMWKRTWIISLLLRKRSMMIKAFAIVIRIMWKGTWIISFLLRKGLPFAGKIMAVWRWG